MRAENTSGASCSESALNNMKAYQLLSVYSLRAAQPLRQTAPANLRSFVKAVRRLITPPWLKPPTTIRPGLIPESISAEMG